MPKAPVLGAIRENGKVVGAKGVKRLLQIWQEQKDVSLPLRCKTT